MADDLVKVLLGVAAAVGAVVIYKAINNDDSIEGAAKDLKGDIKGKYKDAKGMKLGSADPWGSTSVHAAAALAAGVAVAVEAGEAVAVASGVVVVVVLPDIVNCWVLEKVP
ncbi:hypothetical protein WJX82_006828 [Trebouxia sp. C0006]